MISLIRKNEDTSFTSLFTSAVPDFPFFFIDFETTSLFSLRLQNFFLLPFFFAAAKSLNEIFFSFLFYFKSLGEKALIDFKLQICSF